MLALRTAVRKVERLAYSPDGTRLAVGGPTGTEVLEVASGETVALLNWATDPDLAFHGDANSLSVVAVYLPFVTVDLNNPPAQRPGWESGFLRTSLETIRFLPRGDTWLIAHPNRVSLRQRLGNPPGPLRGHVNLWAYTPVEPNVHPRRITVYGTPLRVVFLATIGAVANEHNKYLYVLDGDTGEFIRRHRSGYSSVEHFTGSPCGGYLVGVRQSTLIVWDTAALHLPPKRWANDSRKQFTGVAFHPHGRYLLTASNDKSVKLWDLTCGQVVRSYDWSAGRMRSVAVAPDGLTAAAGSDENLVVLFDLDL